MVVANAPGFSQLVTLDLVHHGDRRVVASSLSPDSSSQGTKRPKAFSPKGREMKFGGFFCCAVAECIIVD